LLIENNLEEMVDRILAVEAPDERRIEWITARNSLSETEIRLVFASQVSREQRLAAADDVVENSGAIPDLINQVDRLHQKYLRLAASQ
jgi:dephospho-CoA kinase